MKTYLLTWNPKYSDADWLADSIARLKREGSVSGRWSCGNNKSIREGDRVFLLKQGSEHPGIVGAGCIVTASYPDRHWNRSKEKQGLSASYVDVEWNELVSEDRVLSRSVLLKGLLPVSLVNIAVSGVAVSPEISLKLEAAWAVHHGYHHSKEQQEIEPASATEGGIVEYTGYRRKRDANLKASALKAARGICAACGFNFLELLDGLGRHVLQVHHRRQLSDSDLPRLTKVSDLVVVCANCHCLIHSDPKNAMEVGELRRRFTAKGGGRQKGSFKNRI